MPTFAFDFDLATVAGNAISVALILVVTLVVWWLLKRLIPKIIAARIPRIREESPEELAHRSNTLANVAVGVMSFVLWIVAGMMVLSEVGVNIAPVLAAVGLAGLAVGFAAQNIIRDYLHGFFIIMEDWYRVGEVAIVAGIGGLVVDVDLRRTVLRDLNGTLHNIPNNKIELASNMTRDWARINLNVPVAYGEDLDHVFRVITEVGAELKEDEVLGPDLISAPRVERVDNFGDSGIEIKVLAETKPIRQWALTGELRKRLKKRFDEEGIEIPWPHTKLYFGNALDVAGGPSGRTAA